MSNSNESGGIGCITLIVMFFLGWSLGSAIQTPWGWFSWDIWPPAIHLDAENPDDPE